MLHQPEGTVEERLHDAEDKHLQVILKLHNWSWNNYSIAMYLGIDSYTIKRVIDKNKHD